MNKDEALRIALEALEAIYYGTDTGPRVQYASIKAIEEALAQSEHIEAVLTMVQPAQEPVGQLQEEAYGRGQVLWFKKLADQSMLYTSPPKREWVGLTDDERNNALDAHPTALGVAYAIEAKLKEKNHDNKN
jgi:hypothetical protein